MMPAGSTGGGPDDGGASGPGQRTDRRSGPLGPTDLKRLHRDWRRRLDLRLALVLDGVQNPYNLGAILRSAAAYRAERVWLAPPTPGVHHPKVAKTALGSERLVAVETLGDEAPGRDADRRPGHRRPGTGGTAGGRTSGSSLGAEAVVAARRAGFTVVAVELVDGSRPLFELELGEAVCLVVGHEERGVHRDTLAAVDHIGYLPQLGKVGSLNVAQAATTALYEATRQSASRTS